MRQLDEITQRNAQMVEHAVAQALAMEGQASTLFDSVALLKLQQGSAEEAVALVMRAIEHRHRVSEDTFIRDITDPTKGFFDRDMYVFVLDSEGHYLAFGGNQAKVGTRVQDIPNIDGAGLMQDILDQAAREPGWSNTTSTTPPWMGKVQGKMSYVQQLDDVVVGCGVYKNLVVT